ncbi:hypothetical protein BDW66DRAFT_162915 [Aspergillus desertorum]
MPRITAPSLPPLLRIFLVCSNALSLAPPVFHRMFKPGVKEGLGVREVSGKLEPPVIRLPDDSAETYFQIEQSTLDAASRKDLAAFIVQYACRPPIIDCGWLRMRRINILTAIAGRARMLLSSLRRQIFNNWDYALENLAFTPHYALDVYTGEQLDIQQTLLTSCLVCLSIVEKPWLRSCNPPQIFPQSVIPLARADATGTTTKYSPSHHNKLDVKQYMLEQLMKFAGDGKAGICLPSIRREPCDQHPGSHKQDGMLSGEKVESVNL